MERHDVYRRHYFLFRHKFQELVGVFYISAGKGKFHAKRFNLSSFNNDIAHCLCGQDATCLVGITKVFFFSPADEQYKY